VNWSLYFFLLFFSIGLSQYHAHGHRVNKLTRFDYVLFFFIAFFSFQFCHLTLNCLIIEFLICFRWNYLGVAARSHVLHDNLDGFGSGFFTLFFIIFFSFLFILSKLYRFIKLGHVNDPSLNFFYLFSNVCEALTSPF